MTLTTDIVKCILWNQNTIKVDLENYEEIKQHTIECLAVPAFSRLIISNDLKEEWNKRVLHQIVYCTVTCKAICLLLFRM